MRSPVEPAFKAPMAAVAVFLAILAGYFLQSISLQTQDLPRWVSSGANLKSGRYETLFTSLFLSGSWLQATIEAVMGLVFATPIARHLGRGPRGLFGLSLFYLVCGALSNLGVILLRPESSIEIFGATGAISALAAGTARIVSGQGRVGSVFSPLVIGMGGAWVVLNLLNAIISSARGVGGEIPWQAPLIGFVCGLVLIPVVSSMTAPKA